VLVPHEI